LIIKKAPEIVSDAHLVEHLENSSPLIFDEVRRWRDLLWDDYLDYKYRKNRSSDVDSPLGL
jgi:hypothetical protein